MLRLAICVTAVSSICFAQIADVAITNAHIYTVDAQRPSASAIAIRGNKILFVGEDVTRFLGPETKKIDARGRAVFPGFIDSHGHMESLGQALGSLDLRGVASQAEIASKVAKAAETRKPGEWIVGHSWDQNSGRPRRFRISDRSTPSPRTVRCFSRASMDMRYG